MKMNGRNVARGIGTFILFLVLYTVIGAIVGVIAVFWLDNYFLVAALAGFFGVPLAKEALDAIMKKYPARGIGVAFILWLLVNYALHFIFYPELTDDVVYHGLVQSAVACVMAWFEFRLPPLTEDQQPNGSQKMGWFRKKSDEEPTPER